jgi:hypothetical protein
MPPEAALGKAAEREITPSPHTHAYVNFDSALVMFGKDYREG